MSRPLLISDCDEVLLHFLPHFAAWLDEKTDLSFSLDVAGFADALRHKDGRVVKEERAWALLDLFFDSEMHRQHLVPGAIEALRAIEMEADIVILTNIGDRYQANRVAQLEAFDIRHRVLCNQGGKGRPVSELIADLKPSQVVFVDDLPVHHESVAKHAPDVWRLHMIAEPRVAQRTPQAAHAHARIDDWKAALPWILNKLTQA